GMEPELDRQFLVSRIPDGLVGFVTSEYGRFHIVGDHCPRHAVDVSETGDQTAQQRLFPHIVLKTDEHVTPVFKPGSEKVARLSLQAFLAQGQVAYLTPVDLQVLTGQAFKAQYHIPRGVLACPADFTHVVVKGRFPTTIRVLLIRTCQFYHANHWDV